MSLTLQILADVSGSMLEGGKHMIVGGVVRATEQYVRLGYGCANLQLAVWDSSVCKMDWEPGQPLPEDLFECRKILEGDSFGRFLNSEHVDRVLLLTDGFLPKADIRAVKQFRRCNPGALRILRIGGDANPQMKGEDVYTPEELIAAFDGWLGEDSK